MSFKKSSICCIIIGLFCVATISAQTWPAPHRTAVGNVSANPDPTPPASEMGSAIFNVQDFFVGGETQADNAIQRAITAAINDRHGGIIYFPKGIYYVNSPIVIGDGSSTDWQPGVGNFISLKGEGRETSKIVAQHDGVVIDFRGGLWVGYADPNTRDNSYTNLSSFNSVSNLSIEKWGNVSPTHGQAISLRRATRPIVENVLIQADNGIGYDYGIVLAQDEARIYNVTIHRCDNGILMLGHPNATTISDSWFMFNNTGIVVAGGAGVRILNNTFGTNAVAAIQVQTNSPHHSSAAIWALEISGNELEGNGAGTTGGAFRQNSIWFDNLLAGSQHQDYAKGVTISNNYFNLERMVNGSGVSLSSPYNISNVNQQKEITFSRNVYQAGNGGTPNVPYRVLSEGLTIGQIPVGIAASATVNPRSLDVAGNITTTSLSATALTTTSLSTTSLSTGNLTIGTGTPITRYLSATIPWDPPILTAGASTTTTISVNGAAIGDPVTVGLTSLIDGKLNLYGAVTKVSNGVATVTVTLVNNINASFNVTNGILRVGVWKH